MSELPFFTVVIPTYNRSNLIEKTIRSVMFQTYKKYEVIIIDNGSTDNTYSVIEPFLKFENFYFFRVEKNQERSFARNKGMELAKGNFVTFLDSDDLMYSNNLKEAANFIEKNNHFHIFHNLYELVSSEGKLLHRYFFTPITNSKKLISNGNFLSCIGVFISKEIYTNYFFDTNPIIIGSEDYDLWVRVLSKYEVGRIPHINSGIVQHGKRSIDKYTITERLVRGKYLLNKIKSDAILLSSYKPYLKNFEVSTYLFVASISNSAMQYKMALKYVLKSIQIDFFCIFDRRTISIIRKAFFHF